MTWFWYIKPYRAMTVVAHVPHWYKRQSWFTCGTWDLVLTSDNGWYCPSVHVNSHTKGKTNKNKKKKLSVPIIHLLRTIYRWRNELLSTLAPIYDCGSITTQNQRQQSPSRRWVENWRVFNSSNDLTNCFERVWISLACKGRKTNSSGSDSELF